MLTDLIASITKLENALQDRNFFPMPEVTITFRDRHASSRFLNILANEAHDAGMQFRADPTAMPDGFCIEGVKVHVR